MNHKPLLVLVSGAAGSGKTTFATQLAKHMNLFHVERDRAFESMRFTFADMPFNREQDGIPAFYGFISDALKANISLVVDATLYKGKSEQDLRPLTQQAHTVLVHCRAENEHQRFYDRETAKDGDTSWVEPFMEHIRNIYPLTVDPLDLGCPRIEVNTTDVYQPAVTEVATMITQHLEALRQKQPTL